MIVPQLRHAIPLLLIAGTLVAREARAQYVRISGASWAQSIDLRPLREDSISAAGVPGEGIYRTTASGQVVRCLEGATVCRFFTSGERASAAPLTHDVAVAAWGLGRGVSFHSQGRFRSSLGGARELWPRQGDRFDLIDAYLAIDRGRYGARLGRLWSTNALGAYNFDGGALTFRRWGGSLEAFGGRALVQGLNEGYASGEIGAVDDIPPEEEGYLIGVRLRARPTPVSALSVLYQRVVRGDRAGLYSERAAFDASTRLGRATLDATLAYDIATNSVNDARLRGARALFGAFNGALEVRRHRPFFELWTIWGAFAPVGFDEGRANLTWRGAGDRLLIDAHGAYRTYAEANTGAGFLPLRSNGWRAGTGATWLPSEHFSASASYDADIGFGSSRSAGSAGVRWTRGDGTHLGASGSAFQTIYEFRVGNGRVLGAALDAGLRLTSELRVAADAGIYRHRLSDGAPGTDWSQRRASLRLEWAVGADPGVASGRGGVR